MRKKKKIVQSLVAGILSLGLCASVAPMGALAAYDRYDVNHDGKINIDDYYYIRNYLNGKFSVVSPTALDVNQNKVIDIADADAVFARIYYVSTSVQFVDITKGATPVNTIPDELLAESGEDELFPFGDVAEPDVISGPRTYYKYNCTKGTYTTYSLMPSLDMQTSSLNANEPDSINATSDDNYYRVNGNGMDGIVKLVDNTFYHGTGFIIDNHTIATAAHCVWSGKEGTNISDGFVDQLKIQICSTDGTVTTTKYTVKEIHVPKSYVDNPTTNGVTGNSCDYALLTVSEDLSAYTHFDLGVVSTDDINNMSEVFLTVSGFPQKVNNEIDPSNPIHIYTSIGQEYGGKDSDEQHLYYTNKTAGGMSGAPVYTVTDFCQGSSHKIINTVVAIHSSSLAGYKFGPAMNSYMLAFYKNNTNVSY